MSKQKSSELGTEALEQLTFDAMCHCGIIPPLTIEAVTSIEAELPKMKLPFGPSDPMELLARLGSTEQKPRIIMPFPPIIGEVKRNLARAAREGGTLSPEIEQRMAEDKAKHLRRDNGNQ